MIVARKIVHLENALRTARKRGTVGFVPTMGDLHEGHLSLVRKSKAENRATVLSIFVNPAQFNQKKDFDLYRRNTQSDQRVARRAGVDILFLPDAHEMYPSDYQTEITLTRLTRHLCGPHRPGHFQGVAAIVLKLLNMVQPDRAYFGMKDYQQFLIVKQLAKDLNIPAQITACPTVREKDGLALSSRNRRVPQNARKRACSIYASLQHVRDLLKSNQYASTQKDVLYRAFKSRLLLRQRDRLEYFEVVHPRTLEPMKTMKRPVLLACAVWIAGTRLIDNLLIAR